MFAAGGLSAYNVAVRRLCSPPGDSGRPFAAPCEVSEVAALCRDPSSITRTVHRLTCVHSLLTGLFATDFLVDDATC